jgi:hypothetical protein
MNETAHRQKEFEDGCLRLRQNDPSLNDFAADPVLSERCTCAKNYTLLGQSLMGNENLTVLSFYHPVLEESAARSLATGMAHSKLGSLFFYRGTKRQEQSESICRILFEGFRSMPCLVRLRFLGATSQELILLGEYMASLQTLQDLMIIRGTEYKCDLWLSQILTRTSSLTRLCIEAKSLGRNGITLLAHGLRCNTSVTALYLPFCGIDDTCLKLFLELWPASSPIEWLYLRDNNIGPQGAQQLLQAVADHPAMRGLILWNNRNIGYDGVRMIGEELLNQTSLTEIDFEGCATWIKYSNSNSAEARAQDKASQLAGRALLEGVKQNARIKKLYASTLHLLPLGVGKEIGFYADLNKMMGGYLLSTDHGLASTVWCYILAKCRGVSFVHKNSLLYFFLCAQPSLLKQQAVRKKKRRELE